jgi:outer membrane murein-binding lipoprotein Lpp
MRNRIGVVGVVVVVGMLVAACGSDPTGSEAYFDLESDYGFVSAERDQLVVDLDAALADVDASAAQLTDSEATALEDLESVFDMAGVAATMWLSCGDPSVIADLPDEVASLRSDVAAAADWFDSVDDYDTCVSRRTFTAADNAVVRQDGIMNPVRKTKRWPCSSSSFAGAREPRSNRPFHRCGGCCCSRRPPGCRERIVVARCRQDPPGSERGRATNPDCSRDESSVDEVFVFLE